MKTKALVFLSSLSLLIGLWYVSTQDSRAAEKDRKDGKESIEAESSEHIVDVVGQKDFDKFLKDNKLVLVDFHADWCPPCRQLKPTIYGLANTYHGKLAVAAVDTDDNQALAKSQNVSGIPDVRLFKDGKQIHQWIGWRPANQYIEKIDSVLKDLEKEAKETKTESKEDSKV